MAGYVLTVTDHSQGHAEHVIEAVLSHDEGEVDRGTAHSDSSFSARDASDLGWYLEKFPGAPFDPAPQVARRIQERLRALGGELLAMVDAALPHTAIATWSAGDWANTRVEVGTTGPTRLPWELMIEAKSGIVPAAQAQAFVRGINRVAEERSSAKTDRVRLLLAVCRPAAGDDVPFQSVARALLEALRDHPGFEIRVLRPATFASLQATLAGAKAEGRPFDLVHFDGHGTIQDGRGYLAFEGSQGGAALVTGTQFASALVAGGTRIAVLNACRSAAVDGAGAEAGSARAHSLAEEAMAAGLRGVVAMQFNLFLSTAVRFVADLYADLADGMELGAAVTRARADLLAEPALVGVADWMVPVVYESGAPQVVDAASEPSARSVRTPDAFVGRDAVLLGIDRAFDTRRLVLLHGMAGCGKTATAAAFARWYTTTGGAGGTLGTLLATGPDLSTAVARVTTRTDRPGLIVIDAVDAVSGEPARGREEVSAALGRLAEAGTRVLLTSRDSAPWLGDRAERILMSGMPTSESVELLRALTPVATVTGALDAWRPVIDHARGNPLALRTLVTVAQAEGLTTRDQLENLVYTTSLGDRGGRDHPPKHVVTSGTANALSDDDLAVLSALTHHHGYAEATHLVHFADGAFSDSLDELSGRTAADFTELFTRAADAGFMQRAHASYFEVHPLLSLAIADALASERNLAHDARLARVFTELKGSEGESAYDEFETGKQRGRSLQWMASEERNFIHAWTLALHNQWWDLLRGPLFGLVRLYEVAGRATEWQQLTATTKSAIAGRPGCEKLDQELTLWEAKAAQEAGDLAKAGRLLRALLGRVPLSPSHARAVVLEALAEVERLADDPACIAHLQEALAFFAGRADHQDQARIHFNLAVAYERVSAIRDLGTALNQLKKSAELHNPRDGLGLGRCFSEVGQVHVLIAEKLEAEGGTASQIAKAQKAAWEASMVALSALPGAANDDRGVVLVRMGVLERGSGNPSAAVDLHTQALAAYTAAGAARGQGIARLQMAWDLVDLAQWSDALLYADAAAAQLGMLGAATATGAQQARDLAKEIRKVMAT